MHTCQLLALPLLTLDADKISVGWEGAACPLPDPLLARGLPLDLFIWVR